MEIVGGGREVSLECFLLVGCEVVRLRLWSSNKVVIAKARF